jgi:xanthine dehydrogenase accessory factor
MRTSVGEHGTHLAPHSRHADVVSKVSRKTGGVWLRPLRDHWTGAVRRHLEQSESPMVRIAVAGVRGSAPREPGACMLISENETQGTIGGGNLEWQALGAARALLAADASLPAVRVRRLVLGRELGQCCGGVVQLWLERFTRADLPLLRSAAEAISGGAVAVITTELSECRVTRRIMLEAGMQPHICFSTTDEYNAILSERIQLDTAPVRLYGAGHVGQALIRVLAELPFEITWIDARAELFPDDLPDNVRLRYSDSPIDEVSTAPIDARHLVMTHDHALDYAICHAILARNDFHWLGLIGSKSKGARFRSRLLRDGIAPERIRRLVCPIGVAGVASKWPAAIAIGVAAQLLQDAGTTSDAHTGAPRKSPEDEECSLRECSGCSPVRGSHS